MIRKDYVPQDESTQLTWADNLSTQAIVSANQSAMAWSATQGALVQSAANSIKTSVLSKEAARTTYLAAVAAADTQIGVALHTIRPLVASGKENPLYTDTAGQHLQVIGTEIPFNPQTYKADVRDVTAVGNATLRIKFAKALGELDAARLLIRKAGQTTWTVAATMMRSPYLHQMTLTTPGVPEALEVCIRGIVGNDEIGDCSDIVAVVLM